MEIPLLHQPEIHNIFWYRIVHSIWVYSDNRFGFSIIENIYFDYLIVPNGSGLIYLQMVHFGVCMVASLAGPKPHRLHRATKIYCTP